MYWKITSWHKGTSVHTASFDEISSQLTDPNLVGVATWQTLYYNYHVMPDFADKVQTTINITFRTILICTRLPFVSLIWQLDIFCIFIPIWTIVALWIGTIFTSQKNEVNMSDIVKTIPVLSAISFFQQAILSSTFNVICIYLDNPRMSEYFYKVWL